MLINPKNYRFTLGATAELKCIVYDPGAPKGKDRMIPGRTIASKFKDKMTIYMRILLRILGEMGKATNMKQR